MFYLVEFDLPDRARSLQIMEITKRRLTVTLCSGD